MSEPPELALSLRVRALWGAIAAAYDEIQRRFAATAWSDVAALARHIGEIENGLQPLLAELGPARATAREPDAALAAVWRDSDALVASLAARLPGLLRAATAARDATAARLARCRIGRAHTASYSDVLALSPRFTSRRI